MISDLFIGNVRSLDGLEYQFGPGINVVGGPNGCGKTTILESVYLLSQGFSFRANDLKELIAWNKDELVLRGRFDSGKGLVDRGVSVARGPTSRGRICAKENGESLRSPTAFFGKCPAVVMQPGDIELLRGAPEVRRHWLDEILCFRSAANAEVLRRYKRILQQRNQWLRQFKRDGCAVGGEELLGVLTEQLVDVGAKLWVARVNLSAEVSKIITGYYRKLSGGVDEITCNYKSSILESIEQEKQNALDEPTFKSAFKNKLADLAPAERAMGMTMAGPHRDDLALCASGYEMRSVGSQGQCRSAAVAMRFAAVDVATQYIGKPVLLLDDIFAELDVNRRDAVAALIREKECQVLIATPQVEELPFTPDAEFHLELH